MKGFVPTPQMTVDAMVDRLFRDQPPTACDSLLDPGCGTGEFIDGVIRWCKLRGQSLPRITGVELNPQHIPVLRAKYEKLRNVRIEHADFLKDNRIAYDFVVGNPPYVAITALSEREKAQYRAKYETARGRFDLYLLFFEQALRNLAPGGRLVFITPEKYLYVETAGPLRKLLARHCVEEIRLLREDTFGQLVTYPTVTVVRNAPQGMTQVVRRDGSSVTVRLPSGDQSWLPLLEGSAKQQSGATLEDLCFRISCGVATGADAVFVQRADELDTALQRFAHPTIAGRQLKSGSGEFSQESMMLIPYDSHGRLLPWDKLGPLGRYLNQEDNQERLRARTCVKRKPWYAFHETPLLQEILRPKILCKDICETPHFWIDRCGEIVPRHSVYYLVPRNPAAIDSIVGFLQSPAAHQWLAQNCQRASKGFLRLQSRVLRRMPMPDDVVCAVCDNTPNLPLTMSSQQAELAFAG